jgi:hypothetical protein
MWAGIDPYRKLIQREPDDNVAKVEGASVAGRAAANR